MGLRIVDRLGWTRLLRIGFAGYWAVSIVLVATTIRPDLLHPADIGTDTSNYIAAAERMADKHQIYDLQPGDRPVPLDNPPDWNVPILSPPTVGTLYLPTLLMPDASRFFPTWALGLAGTAAVGFLAAALSPPLLLALFFQFMPGLSITAWSGNVNSLIVPVIALAFFGVRSDSRALQAVAGIAVAAIACAKIGPLLIGLWIVTQRRTPAVIGLVASGAVIVGLTTVLGGTSSVLAYFEVVRAAASAPTQLSIPGLLRQAGVNDVASNLAFLGALVAMAGLVVALRARPSGLLVAVLGAIFATSVVRYESVSVVVAAGVAWLGRGLLLKPIQVQPDDGRRQLPRIAHTRSSGPTRGPIALSAAAGATVMATAVVMSAVTGGLDMSRVRITNPTDDPVVVRFSVVSQSASFGFIVPSHASVEGWHDRGGASPPIASFWTPSCQFLAQTPIPRRGGLLDAGAFTVMHEGEDEAGQPAPFFPDCAAELIAKKITP